MSSTHVHIIVEWGRRKLNWSKAISYYAKQEKIAEEMLSMARSLKETTSAAGRVVRDDTRRIQASSRLADKNLDKLETQSKRLEAHVKKCCDWWVWISLLAVCFTFIMMILFMKLFKKRTF